MFKKFVLATGLVVSLFWHSRSLAEAANPPIGGTAPTGAITTLTSAVTGSGSAQTINIGSSVGCSVNGYVSFQDNSPEVEQITAVPSGTSITVISQFNHSVGASLVCALTISTTGVPTGSAGTPNAAVVTVQGISGGTPVGAQTSQASAGNVTVTVGDTPIWSSISSATTTALAPDPGAGKANYLTGLFLWSSGSNTIQFEYGTQTTTPCDTGTTVLGGVMALSAGNAFQFSFPNGLLEAAGATGQHKQFCVVTTTSNAITVIGSYAAH